MSQRPIHIWLIIVLLAAFAAWLFYGVAASAWYFIKGNHSLHNMVAYVPVLLGACACAVVSFALYRGWSWVKWSFLLPVAAALLQLLSLAPYLLVLLRPVSDPAAKASIGYVLSGVGQPLLFLAVAIALAAAVFRYFRREARRNE